MPRTGPADAAPAEAEPGQPELSTRLDKLTEELPAPAAEPEDADAEQERKEKLSAADAKLNDLLGRK